MTNAIVITNSANLPAGDIADLVDRAAEYASQARASATLRAYRSDWEHFSAWCSAHNLVAMPATPATVGVYLAAHAETLSIATLTRRLSSIATGHRSAGHGLDTKHPAIRDTLRGMRRAHGTAQRQAGALTVTIARRVLAEVPSSRLLDLRDRAILLVGLAGAFRRSELVALDLADIIAVTEGLRITIRRSKGDQDGSGQIVQLGRTGRDTCPVAALEAWIVAAGIRDGAIFRSVTRHGAVGERLSTNAVAIVVKRRAAGAGLDPATYSGHSLRAGFATSAAQAGLEERTIAKQTRHASMVVLRRYIREGELFRRNLADDIGL